MDKLRPQKKPYPLSRSDIPLPTGTPRFPPGPHKLNVLSTFTICGLLLTSTWLGLSWAPFCLPEAPRSSAGPPKTQRFCIGTSVLMQKHRVLRGPAARGRCLGQTKRRPRQPQPRVNGLTGRRDKGQRVHGIGLGGQFGGAAPVRSES